MFKKARISLTAWYLLIIVTISISFSFVIYNVLSHEVERFSRIQRVRFSAPANLDPDLVSEVKGRIVLFLVLANGVIVIASGGLSYFLAGRTLRPIKEMVKDQKSFISNASHDLRTPLSAISLSMEVALKDKAMDIKTARDVLTQCLKQVVGLQRLTQNLLELSSFNYHSSNTRFTRENVFNILKEVLYELAPMYKEKKLAIINEVDQNFVAELDKLKIRQLFMIILDNAIKYSRDKEKITLSSQFKDSNFQIRIKDQGLGIAKKEISKVFDKFYRSDKSRSNFKTSGYGLGLSIAKEIVDLHGGDISVKSVLGKGSTFVLQLPFSKQTRI